MSRIPAPRGFSFQWQGSDNSSNSFLSEPEAVCSCLSSLSNAAAHVPPGRWATAGHLWKAVGKPNNHSQTSLQGERDRGQKLCKDLHIHDFHQITRLFWNWNKESFPCWKGTFLHVQIALLKMHIFSYNYSLYWIKIWWGKNYTSFWDDSIWERAIMGQHLNSFSSHTYMAFKLIPSFYLLNSTEG